MTLTLYMSLLALTLTWILTSIILIVTKKSTQKSLKMSPFECGFNPMSPARAPFSLRFFLLAILFLIFDVEISLMLPIPLSTCNLEFTVTSLTFLLILNLGLFYEWKKQSLEWK